MILRHKTILTLSDAGADDRFGMAVKVSRDGTVLIIGAAYWDGDDEKADE